MAMDHLKKIIRPGFHIQFPSSTVEERKTLHEKKDGETSAKRHSRTRRSPSPTNRVRELGECVAEQNKVIRQLCDLLKEVRF
jgi:hypothetical protein